MKQVLFILIILLLINNVHGQSVVQSKHNLSLSGVGGLKSNEQVEVCIFCHTTHSANPKAPLWNKNISGTRYTLYDSSTMDASPGQPDGSSILCLSCHDGTIAIGNTLNGAGGNLDNTRIIQRGNLGTDLSDDHPISFEYTKALVIRDKEINDPITLDRHILDKNGKMQCTSCHDSHQDIEGNFLKRSNQYSDLCLTCHDKKYWINSSHNTSTNKWKGKMTDPWEHLDNSYETVAENGCSNCHDVHNAEGSAFLMKKRAEEENCLDCHNGNVADSNILSDFLKPYKHDVFAYTGMHDPMESEIETISNNMRHIECSDCHDPHASYNGNSSAPFVKGSNYGVRGINLKGTEAIPVVYEYEICFKCHGNNPVSPEHTPRYLGNDNLIEDFSPQNISYHPVIEQGKNMNPRGLLSPLTGNSMIYCTSCHAGDGESSKGSPHGSIYPRILKANYNMDKTPQLGKNWPVLIQANFELCFECHDVNVVTNIHMEISNGHFMETIGCNTCHDPHGYQGGTYSENRYGINFDRTVIQPNPWNGKMIDLDQKKCFMTCHDPAGVVNYTHSPGGDDY